MNIPSLPPTSLQARPGAAPTRPRPQDSVLPASDQLIEQFRSLAKATGSSQLSERADQMVAAKKSREAFAARVQIDLSAQQQSEVVGFVEKSQAMPEYLNEEQQKCLDDLKNLGERGVQFCKRDFSPLSAGEATIALLRHPLANSMNDPDKVVNYLSETEFMGRKSLCTVNLRPQTVGALRFFLDKSLDKLSFLDRDRKPITEASKFVLEYGNDPSQALLNLGSGNWTYQHYQEEKTRTQAELAQVTSVPPTMVETSEHVNIGGILIKKRVRPS